MDILTGIRLIRENTFQTTREILRLAEDEIERNRAAIVEAYDLASVLWRLWYVGVGDDPEFTGLNKAERELKNRLEQLHELAMSYAEDQNGLVES